MTTDDVKMRCQVPVGKSETWGQGLCGHLSSAWYHVVFWVVEYQFKYSLFQVHTCHLQFSLGKKLDPVFFFFLDQWFHYCSAR